MCPPTLYFRDECVCTGVVLRKQYTHLQTDPYRKMATSYSFRDSEVYQRAQVQSQRICEWSRQLPEEEQPSLGAPVREAAGAVAALIAEAWGARHCEQAFQETLAKAHAKAKKTQALLDRAWMHSHLGDEQHRLFDEAWGRICTLLRRIMRCTHSFCRLN